MKKKEIEEILYEVSKVYCELTNNKLSKPNYKAEVVLDEVRIQQEADMAETIKEYRQSIIDMIDEEIGQNREVKNISTNKPTRIYFEGSIIALTELKDKL